MTQAGAVGGGFRGVKLDLKEDEDLEKLGKVRRAFEAAEFREQ